MMRLVLSVLAALLVLTTPAFAETCDDSLLTCDYGKNGWPIVVPIETEQLTGIVELRTDNGSVALDTYRSLVRAPYELPERPAVALWFADATIPHAFGPWRLTAFSEASVAIKVRHRGEEGWYHLSMPTNGQGNYDLGRGVGFPKYLADTTFARDAAGWRAASRKGARETMALRWSAGGASAAEELTRWSLYRSPFFSFNPVFTGAPTRVKYTVKPYVPLEDLTFGYQPDEMQVAPLNGLAKPIDGRLEYWLDPDLDTIDETLPDIFPSGRTLADVIEPQGEVTGQHWHGEGYLMIQSARIE